MIRKATKGNLSSPRLPILKCLRIGCSQDPKYLHTVKRALGWGIGTGTGTEPFRGGYFRLEHVVRLGHVG
jgi:hypothetical protein